MKTLLCYALILKKQKGRLNKYPKAFTAVRSLIRLNNWEDLFWEAGICSHVMPTNKSTKQDDHGSKAQGTM